jgi:hypothetical protein
MREKQEIPLAVLHQPALEQEITFLWAHVVIASWVGRNLSVEESSGWLADYQRLVVPGKVEGIREAGDG